MLGEVVGEKYELVRALPADALYDAFAAREVGGAREVVLWLPRADLLPRPEARVRFVGAARQAAQADAAHQQRVVDAGVDPKTGAWVALAPTIGQTLAERIARGKPAPDPVVAFLAQSMAQALDGVHAAGLIHGFLRAGDVVMAGEWPRLAGMGLWVTADRGAVLAALRPHAHLLAPEVRTGEPPSRRADVYALAVILAQVALGQAAESQVEAAAIRDQLRRERPRLDAALRAALSTQPGERPPTASRLAAELHLLVPPAKVRRPTLADVRAGGPVGESAGGVAVAAGAPAPRPPWPAKTPPPIPPDAAVREAAPAAAPAIEPTVELVAELPTPVGDPSARKRLAAGTTPPPDEGLAVAPRPPAPAGETRPPAPSPPAPAPVETLAAAPPPAAPIALPLVETLAAAPIDPRGLITFRAPSVSELDAPPPLPAPRPPRMLTPVPVAAHPRTSYEHASTQHTPTPPTVVLPMTGAAPAPASFPRSSGSTPVPQLGAAELAEADAAAELASGGPRGKARAGDFERTLTPLPLPPPEEVTLRVPAPAPTPELTLRAVPEVAPLPVVSRPFTGSVPSLGEDYASRALATRRRTGALGVTLLSALIALVVFGGAAYWWQQRQAVSGELGAEAARATAGVAEALPPPPPPAPAPAAVPATPCPEGMLLVENRAGRYCIDRDEAHDAAGKPLVGLDAAAAAAGCSAAGKRLCTGDEWEEACRGRSRQSYPWGATPGESPCNLGPGGMVEKIGSHPGCVSASGALDMSGNAAEWDADGKLRGGSAIAPGDGRCSRPSRVSGRTLVDAGYRCCLAAK